MSTSTAQEQDRLDPALVRLGAGRGPRRIGRLSGVITGPVSVAPILGPVVGGLIVQGAGWRWLFLVNVPVGLLALLPAARTVPADGAERDTAVRPDVAQPGTGGWGSVRAVAPAAGWALLAGYAAHAPRTPRTPLLDLRLFWRRPLLLDDAAAAVLHAGLLPAPRASGSPCSAPSRSS
ncbi:MFS transporter [Streptomyces goshikiensis]|uniref:MFS transporter n=1 Tax=Streptomyces goshikiensis TaxID=1942 RepID=UPI00332D780F